jgi:hypothetical protein
MAFERIAEFFYGIAPKPKGKPTTLYNPKNQNCANLLKLRARSFFRSNEIG